jgi:short-subunit dehydrogenase
VVATTKTLADKYGPWALVLGASEGIGAEFARYLAEAGINVALVARRASVLNELAAQLRAANGIETRTLPIDLTDADAADQLARATMDLEVGLLIMNAGADDHGRDFLDVPVEEWLALVQRNNVLTVRACHHFAQPMRERRRGGMILVSSGAGWGGGARIAIYSASKAFDRNLAEGLWAELAPFDVDVLSLVVPPTDTPAMRRLFARANLPADAADSLAAAEDIARSGIDHLGEGPVYIPDEEPSGPVSAAARRELVLTISEGTKAFFPTS